ncbi:MAG: GIY-YIG nuclease family protein [Methylobacter sp.]
MQLYKISFTSTDKVYIGISKISAEYRFKKHCRLSTQTVIAKAIRKHEGVTVTILAECDDWGELCKMERAAIIEHNSKAPNGYNRSDGGEHSASGVVISTEARKKQSELLKNYYKNHPEALIKKSEIAKNNSLETKSKRAASIQKTRSTPESRAKTSFALIGRPVSDDTRKKMSEKLKGRVFSEETLAKMTFAHSHISLETRKKMSDSAKANAPISWAKRLNRPFSYLPKQA